MLLMAGSNADGRTPQPLRALDNAQSFQSRPEVFGMRKQSCAFYTFRDKSGSIKVNDARKSVSIL